MNQDTVESWLRSGRARVRSREEIEKQARIMGEGSAAAAALREAESPPGEVRFIYVMNSRRGGSILVEKS